MYDVIIIGSGVSRSAAARELSRYDLKIGVLEKEEDVCCGTSKANSGIVHAGFDASPGSLMAKMNVRGNRMMEQLAKDLDIPFERNGSLVLCFAKEERNRLEKLKEQGEENGVEGLQILSGDEVRRMEPDLSEEVYAALYAPTGGIVCPFELNLALAENAFENGVEFYFDIAVEQIEKDRRLPDPCRRKNIRDPVCGQCGGCLCGCLSQYGKCKKDPYHTAKGRILSAG